MKGHLLHVFTYSPQHVTFLELKPVLYLRLALLDFKGRSGLLTQHEHVPPARKKKKKITKQKNQDLRFS